MRTSCESRASRLAGVASGREALVEVDGRDAVRDLHAQHPRARGHVRAEAGPTSARVGPASSCRTASRAVVPGRVTCASCSPRRKNTETCGCAAAADVARLRRRRRAASRRPTSAPCYACAVPAISAAERFQRVDVDLRERREGLDRVAQHVERHARADRQRRLLQPLARLGPERVGAGQPLAVAEQRQEAVALGVGARVRRGLRDLRERRRSPLKRASAAPTAAACGSV